MKSEVATGERSRVERKTRAACSPQGTWRGNYPSCGCHGTSETGRHTGPQATPKTFNPQGGFLETSAYSLWAILFVCLFSMHLSMIQCACFSFLLHYNTCCLVVHLPVTFLVYASWCSCYWLEKSSIVYCRYIWWQLHMASCCHTVHRGTVSKVSTDTYSMHFPGVHRWLMLSIKHSLSTNLKSQTNQLNIMD